MADANTIAGIRWLGCRGVCAALTVISRAALTTMTAVVVLAWIGCHRGPSGEKDTGSDGNRPGEQNLPVLRVGCDPTYPPMEFPGDDGKATGFDPDLIAEAARRIGMRADVQNARWEGIFQGLKNGHYDCLISSINITDERRAQVDFVEYMKIAQIFVVKPGIDVKTEEDLAGKVVAVQVDTTSYRYVTEDLKQTRKVAIKEIKGFRDATETFTAVKVGHADVIVTDEPVGRWYAMKDPRSFAVAGRAIAPEPVGIALRKGSTKLQADLTRAIEQMKQDGTYRLLCEKWFGAEPVQ
jgi:polar amino acid transport system substrate-binding protein